MGGDDTLSGNEDADTLFGGAGGDTMYGDALAEGDFDLDSSVPVQRLLAVTRELGIDRQPRTLLDAVEISFGIRSIDFDPDRGFALNGVPVKFKGVCLHHDAGSLGAAGTRKPPL